MQNRDHQQSGVNRVDGYSDFMLSSRVSYEMDLKGPWYVPFQSAVRLYLLRRLI